MDAGARPEIRRVLPAGNAQGGVYLTAGARGRGDTFIGNGPGPIVAYEQARASIGEDRLADGEVVRVGGG